MTESGIGRSRWLGPAALVAFVGPPLLLLGLTLLNLVNWAEINTAFEERLQRVVQLESRSRGVGKAAPQIDTAAVFLSASDANLARAELQKRLVGLIEQFGGRVLEVRADEEPATNDSVLVRFSFEADNDALIDIVGAVETSVPFLTVEALNLRPIPRRGTGSEESHPVLRAVMAIRGYQRENRQ